MAHTARRSLATGGLCVSVGALLTLAGSLVSAWVVPANARTARVQNITRPSVFVTFIPPRLPTGPGWAEPVQTDSSLVSTFTLRRLSEPTHNGVLQRGCQYDFNYGFPFRSMAASRTAFHGSGISWVAEPGSGRGEIEGIVIERSGNDWTLLPTRVLWPGFIGNTLGWGGASVAIVAAWYFFRGKRRSRRGQCRACGYEARNLPRCPECGRLTPTIDTA